MKKVAILGAGFSGLAAAASLAKNGCSVSVLEKHSMPGGRARFFESHGFKFDMGPSWYWMPEVFENFYQEFGHTTEDFYNLKRLSPSYSVVFSDQSIQVPSDIQDLYKLFETIEPGSSSKLKKFLSEASYKYEHGMNTYVWKPGQSFLEYLTREVFSSVLKLDMLSSVSTQVRKLFTDPKLISILEFPVLFLGAKPSNIPALYTLMNHADLALGTWYPMGGMHQAIDAMYKICLEQGVEFYFNHNIEQLEVHSNKIETIQAAGKKIEADMIGATLDYHHLDQQLLPASHRAYSKEYWQSRTMAPSSILFYIGLDRKIPDLHHHTLFFDANFEQHAVEIYDTHKPPSDPLFYVCAPSVTDHSVAPPDQENLFFLIPISTELKQDEIIFDLYFETVVERMQKIYDIDISKHIVFKREYCIDDFKSDYNAFKGNAYGLANTLLQTGPLKPKMKHPKVTNLFMAGQLTVPGPGVPPSIISGQLMASQILKQ